MTKVGFNKQNSIKLLFLMLFSFSLSNCSDGTIYNKYKDLNEGYWSVNEPLSFEFTINDTSQNYQLDYYVRNSMQYDYYNLYIAYSLENGQGDTLRSSMHESNLVDPTSGKPFGSSAGDYYDHQIPLFDDFHFSDTGTYKFSMRQYMREDTVMGIHAMGLRVKPLVKGN